MDANYPILKYPSLLIADNYKNHSVDIPKKPLNPTKELVFFQGKSFFSTSFWLIIGIMIISPIAPQSDGLATFQLISIAIIAIYRLLRKQGENADYKKKLKTAERKYEQEMHDYKRQLSIYQDAVAHQNELQNTLANNEGDFQKALLLKKVYDRFGLIIVDSKENKNGVSELQFYNKLKARFRNRILRNKKIGPFTPDFIYYDNVRQIYIDIEIDEPYDLMSGTVIHYDDTDSHRDNYFTDLNWIVLRFSEYQIITASEDCLQCIENVIQLFEYGETRWNPVVEKDEKWTIELAELMEKNNYRENYLGIEPVVRVPVVSEKLGLQNSTKQNVDYDDDLPF